jgi:IgA Peptidase M64
MQTIVTNGPVSNRLNIVVLSEGYTTNQLAQFLVDATNAVNALLSHTPYQEYSNYFNAFAIKVASNQSGSSLYDGVTTNDTYFHSSYDYANNPKLITIPPNFADTNYSHGQGIVDALLQTFMPNCQLSILLVNERYYPGGSDGSGKTAIASTGALLSEMPPYPPGMLTHETGHVLANLGDEYTTPYPGFPDTEEPNTTRQTNRLLIKWKAWISPDTPVPSPDSIGDGVVGLFQGAHYHTTGWYRPELNCAMGVGGAPFCAVCSEALVLAIYQRVRPVDGFSPASTNFSVSSTQAMAFSVSLLQPATHNLNVQWFTNGVPQSGATNLTFTLSPQALANDTNWVSAVVQDNTPLVRNDPTNLLSQTVTWVGLQLRLDSPTWLAGGKFAFRIAGNAPQGVVVQSSTNLLNWVRVKTNSLVGGQFWYTNSAAGSSPRIFYRATTPP